jgi:hypothetical protein
VPIVLVLIVHGQGKSSAIGTRMIGADRKSEENNFPSVPMFLVLIVQGQTAIADLRHRDKAILE